ncbi:MAG TPA: dihydrolipoyl dehydrogenase [Pyrinomonadaceae bacterium]|nr:dihydrolipoyl dehydrogenase [Pyrinomonadaceae bacterium]
MADNTFDLVIIGSGPGGYVAAIRAAQLGMKTACVEAGALGGVCNNVGCIPTKAMLESALHARRVKELSEFGVTVGDVQLDIGVAARRSQKVADQGARGIAYLFKKNGVEHVKGWGRLAGGGKVLVAGEGGERTLSAKNIIVATGSRAKSLPFLKIDRDRVWSSDEAVFPKALPASLAIIGSGAVGMEFADVYQSFGTRVTVIEALERVLPVEDRDVSAVVEKSYRKRGIDVFTSARLEKADVGQDGVRLTMKVKDGKDQTVEAERVLVAVGRAPIIDDIGLEEAGVRVERGFITVDEHLRTNVPGVFAIGDVIGPPMLAHKASHEGIVAVEKIAGYEHAKVDYNNIPGVTYCHPEVASVGLTEEAARAKGLDIEAGTFPWSANGRARTAGETEGFIKVIRDKRYGELLGAHIVGPQASELIAEFVVGRHLETTVEEMASAVHPHPTLSDAVPEAALAALGRAIHI